jgi:hypothetical protein
MSSILNKSKICQIAWDDLSPLVQEGLRLGFQIKSKQRQVQQQPSKRRPLPAGNRFYHDSSQETESRVLEWLIRMHPDNCWFFTATFRDYLNIDKADRMLRSFLARLGQAHRTISGAALLKSAHSTEWQQRDVIHYHLLVFGNRLGALSRKRWEHRWQTISGGFAANYDAELKAAPYLAKHQLKERPGGNLHFGGAWRGIRPPRSITCARADGEAQMRDDRHLDLSAANDCTSVTPLRVASNGSRGMAIVGGNLPGPG